MQKVMVPDFVMGIDLGDKFSRYCVLDAQGDVVEVGRLATTRKGLTDLLDDREPVRIAIEVGTHSPWISRLIAKLGHRVIIANPRQVRLIYQNKKKNDSLDAENLARLARVDPKLLAPVQHRSSEAQASLAILRARDALVRSRTELVNHVRGSVKSFGFRLPGSSTRYFHRKVVDDIPFELRPALDPLLDLLKEITERISAFDQELEALSETKYPETSRLRQIHGVGVLTALAFVLIIEDPRRFARSRTVGAFVGLTPRQSDSGDAQPQLRITKAGDEYLRRLLVGSAQHILGPFGVDCDLRRWGEALAQRGGKNAKKRAIVAVSRKLAVLLHRLWISGEAYEPLRKRGGLRRRA